MKFFFFHYYRVEYDAYRTDLELMSQAPKTDTNAARMEEAQQTFQQQKEHFEKLKSDVAIKIRFLDENRVSISFKIFWCQQKLLKARPEKAFYIDSI